MAQFFIGDYPVKGKRHPKPGDEIIERIYIIIVILTTIYVHFFC